jgi:hypothetical protein
MGHPSYLKFELPHKFKIPTLSQRTRQGWGTLFGLRVVSLGVGILRLRELIRARFAQDDRLSRVRSGLEVETSQIFAEGTAQVAALQGEFYGGFQESQLVAGVVAFAFVDVSVHFFLL